MKYIVKITLCEKKITPYIEHPNTNRKYLHEDYTLNNLAAK